MLLVSETSNITPIGSWALHFLRQTQFCSCGQVRQEAAGPTYVLVYVEDNLVPQQLTTDKSVITSCFEVRDVGEARFILRPGKMPYRDPVAHALALKQRSIAEPLLEQSRLSDAQPRTVTLPPGTRLTPVSEEQPARSDGSSYRALVGELMILATSTRPDIAQAESALTH